MDSLRDARSLGLLRLGIPTLRVAAIIVPVVFWIVVDILRHTVLLEQLHTPLGFVGISALVALSVTAFSYTVFGLVGRLQRGIAEHNRQLAVLNKIAGIAAEKRDFDTLLEASLHEVLEAMEADAGLICLLDRGREEHSAACATGFLPETVRRIQHAKLREDVVASEVVRTRRPVIMDRVMDDPRVAAAARAEGIESFISAPLLSDGEVNGILVIASRSSRRYTSVDRGFLEGIGGQLGMAIGKAANYAEAQQRNKDLQALLTVGRSVSSSLNLDDVLRGSLDTLIEATSGDAAEVWLAEGNEVVLRCHRGGPLEAFLEMERFPIGEGIPGLVAQTGRPLLVHDLPSDPRFLRQRIVRAGFHTFGAFPLRSQGRVTGVLAIAARSPDALAASSDVALLEGVAESLAVATENARLYEQVRDLGALQERERIAREMHDSLGQLLGYVNTQTMAVRKMVSDGQAAHALQELTRMEDITRDLYADAREGILGLKTAAQRDKGLLPALVEYVGRFKEMSGLDVAVCVTPEAESVRIPSSMEIQLIRIIQEALSNVRKHARATEVQVAIELTEAGLRVEIVDDGQGFDLEHVPSGGWPRFGLQTMPERAQAVGGNLTIESSPGRGTRVVVTLPLDLPARPRP